MDRKFSLILLLTMAASTCGLAAEVRDAAPIIRGWKGEDIRLPCHFQGEAQAVIWGKESDSQQQRLTVKAGFIDGNFESLEKGFDIDKNFSLVITALEVADEGLYLCQVVLTNSEDFELSNLLTVSSMASTHTIEECVDITQSRQSRCIYQSPNTPTFDLTCVVSGFKPNISMLWTEESGKRLNSVVSRQEMLSDSTYERSETITVSTEHGREQTFMCMATGDSLNGTSIEEITLLPISGKRNNVGFIVGLVIGVSVAVFVLFVLVGKFLQKYHPHFLPRKGCGWNPCWRRPKRVDEEETEMLAPLSRSFTKEQVEQIKEELKAYYRMSRRKVTVDPLNFMDRVHLDDIYTNLSLIDQSDMRKTTPIAYEDLVTNDGNLNLSKRLLIQGEGGVGKTTLCSKIAWDWCQGRILQDLDMVLVIPLRDVTDGKSIGGIVQKYFTDSTLATEDEINTYISNNLNRILIVFDGFDEFKGEFEERSRSEVIRILGLEQYKSCKVIVTTRPWRTHEFTVIKSLVEAYTFIRVDGFNKDNLRIYIRKYFGIRGKDTEMAEDLITFMEENDVIQSNMAPFPIYSAMLCLMWEEFSKERRKEMTKMQTFSEIFGEMISFLKDHYASKACQNLQKQKVFEHLKEAAEAIHDISEIAFNGSLQNNMTFPEEMFRDCHDAMEICCRVGVLTIEGEVITRERRRQVNIQSLLGPTVSFPHKLFQEYISGLYIENVYTDNRVTYNQLKNKLLARFEQFRYLLYFISTLRNEIRLDIIGGLTKCADQYFCVDVAFECHTEEAARAVGERWDEYELSPDMSEHTKSGVVFMLHSNQARSLHIDRFNCGRTLSLDLAEGMSSSTLLREVTMDSFSSKFQTDFYRIVANKASTCQIQNLTVTTGYWNDNLQYQSSMGKDLARWVCTMPRLSTFSVKCHNLPNGFFSTAAEMAKFCKLYELSMVIDSGQISESEATAAAVFLCHMPHLRRARITCDNLPRTFFTTMASQTTTLEKQIASITINEKPLNKLLGGKHESATQDNHINNADRTGFPPMEPATTHGHSSVTEALVDHDADLKVSSESRQTYFYTSVRLDDDE